MFDADAFSERAAILEYDAGFSRFEAETLAAKYQGVSRLEAINAERSGNSAERGHNRPVARQSRQNDVPGMQPIEEEKE